MATYITGDIHGDHTINKFEDKYFPQQKNLSKSDYVIIAGDFGLLWDGSEEEKKLLSWLNNLNFTTLWIDGNHENFNMINEYPVEYWNGGKVHKISDSIIHLMRGQVFDIEGKLIFTMGGAISIDKMYRKENISWWSEENPNEKELQEGLDILKLYNNKVNYIITHDCSERMMYEMYSDNQIYRYSHRLNEYFDLLENTIEYDYWFFGHHHVDCKYDNKLTQVYNRIIKI